MFSVEVWDEYESVAEWCAKRGIKGDYGDKLPKFISSSCLNAINYDLDAFKARVNDYAYELARMGD